MLEAMTNNLELSMFIGLVVIAFVVALFYQPRK